MSDRAVDVAGWMLAAACVAAVAAVAIAAARAVRAPRRVFLVQPAGVPVVPGRR